MTRRLGLDKCLSTRGSYSLSFSLDGGILTVERLSYEPWWRKILLTGLFFIPFLVFIVNIYCINRNFCRFGVCCQLPGGSSFDDSYKCHLFYRDSFYKYFVFKQSHFWKRSILIYWCLYLQEKSVSK